MNVNETALLDPFDISTPDEATELTALTRALELAEGFRLLFVCCNQIPQRERLMAEVRARSPKLNIQTIFFREPMEHLLDAMQEQLATPMPDAVFVSGLEFSLPVAAEAQATPLIANLNASRNSFAQTLPCPVVLWVPEYVLTAIMQGAPDFFSIRSGVYFFAAKLAEISIIDNPLSTDWLEVENLSQAEKQERTTAIKNLLSDYESLSSNQRDYNAELRLNFQLGQLLYLQGAPDLAMKHFISSLKLAEALGDQRGISSSLHNLGAIYQWRGEPEAALKSYRRSLKIKEELGDKRGTAISLGQIGNLHYLRGEPEVALKCYQQSLKIAEELNEPYLIASSLHQLGVIYQGQGDYDLALVYYQRSLALREKLGDQSGVSRLLHQLGVINQDQGKYDTALEHFEASLRLKEELGDKHGSALSLGQIGRLFVATKNFAQALKPLLIALSILAEFQSPYTEVAIKDLRELREQWDKFDSAWREATGQNVPEELK